MKSKFLRLGIRDLIWGMVYALSPVVVPIGSVLSSGNFPSKELLIASAAKSIPVIAVYLFVHLLKNSQGEFYKREPIGKP